MGPQATISEIAAWLKRRDDLIVIGHVSPDGDAVGSVLAVTLALQALGKRAVACLPGPVPGLYRPFPGWEQILEAGQALPFAPRLSSWLLFVCLGCFGFATVIGWNFYAESCLRYLVGDRAWAQRLYRLAYLLVIAVSPLISVRSAWAMADILNIFMAAPNLLALFLLRKEIHR